MRRAKREQKLPHKRLAQRLVEALAGSRFIRIEAANVRLEQLRAPFHHRVLRRPRTDAPKHTCG